MHIRRTKYFKRVVNGITTELHYHEDRGEYMKGKSYPENVNSFNTIGLNNHAFYILNN